MLSLGKALDGSLLHYQDRVTPFPTKLIVFLVNYVIDLTI